MPGKNYYYLVILSLLIKLNLYGQQNRFSGYVLDSETNETLVGANIYSHELNEGTITNNAGYFTIPIQNSSAKLKISYVGYKTIELELIFSPDTIFTVFLTPGVELNGLDITSKKSYEDNNLTGISPFSLDRVYSLPSLGGEKDIVKGLTQLAGVTEGKEGFSSLLVRGGNSDQNLFILDNAPIYNTGRIFNFFSVFNVDAIKKVDIYKGNFPAKYGGRLSSVVNIVFRDGNNQNFEGLIDVGLINSRVRLEGPLGQSKNTRYLFCFRTTFFDLLNLGKVKEFEERKSEPNLINTGFSDPLSFIKYSYYDINAKITHSLNNNNKLYLNLYTGDDFFRLYYYSENPEVTKRKSGNTTLTLRSTHAVPAGLFIQTSLSYIRNAHHYSEVLEEYRTEKYNPVYNQDNQLLYYANSRKIISSLYSASNRNYLYDVHANVDISGQITPRNHLNSGITLIRHEYSPGRYNQISSLYDTITVKQEIKLNEPVHNAWEMAGYFEHKFQVNNRIFTTTGIRYSGFLHKDSWYQGFEPRVSLAYKSGSFGSFNLSYSKMRQYNHTLTQNEQLMDKVVWVPSTSKVPPQTADQYSFGYAKDFLQRNVSLSINTYYKTMDNLVYYKFYQGHNYLFSKWENSVETGGKGLAYGIETEIEKSHENYTIFLAYSLSWNYRKFSQLNRGNQFPHIYDRRHVFSISGNTDINDKWSLSAFWTISSGSRINFPDGQTINNPYGWNLDYFVYSELNNNSLPCYHRLDVGAQRKFIYKDNPLVISINIYNAYFRRNPNLLIIRDNKVKAMSYLPIIPSLNVSYKF